MRAPLSILCIALSVLGSGTEQDSIAFHSYHKTQLQVGTANAIFSAGQMPVLLSCGKSNSNDFCQQWKKYEPSKDDRSLFLKSQTTPMTWKSCSQRSFLFTGPQRETPSPCRRCWATFLLVSFPHK